MLPYAVSKDRRLRNLIPFGLGSTKPRHFRDMFGIIWKNRDNLPYAYDVLTKGVCDGCALGVAGLHDWTISGVHLCMTRLNLLRLNTISELDHKLLTDISALEKMDNAQLRDLGRLAYPMIRETGAKGFRRISWEEAYARIARRIRGNNPRRFAFFLTSRGITNEIYYMAQKVARFLGTNNVDNAARLCHSPSSAAMKKTIGVAASTCSYKDWYGTDLLVFFGSNPANDQPVSTKYLHEAKELGTKVVMVNPYLEPGMKKYWVPSVAKSAIFGTNITDFWFPVAQGGDIAFISGVLKIIVEQNWTNNDFIREHTTGFKELATQVTSFDWPDLERQSGLPKDAMMAFAEMLRDANNAVFVWSMGITQHSFGGDGVHAVLNLALSRGYLGRDKCGVMPIRGHSSVQGGAEMGAYATAFPGGIPVTPDNANALSQQYGFPVPDWAGLTSTEMVEASARGDLDLLYCLGGNFLRTLPEPDYVRRALANIPLRVHQDIILTDQMFIEAKEEVILLPAKTRYEQDDGGTETSTERRVMFSPEIPRQVGEAKAEWKILRELAATTHPERAHLLGCESGWQMREEIARVVPFYRGVETLRKTGDAFQYGGAHLCEGGICPTSDGRAHFHTVELPGRKQSSDSFHVSTRRGKQFNTLIYAEVDPLNGAPRNGVLMSPDDAARLHLCQGDRISLINNLGSYHGTVHLAAIASGNLQIHWPEGNSIIRHDVIEPSGGIPDYTTHAQVVVRH